MKGKRRIPPILVSALLTAGMLFCSGTSVQAELNFGELGSENNQIAAPAAGIAASSEAVALDDLGISIAPGSYISIEQTDGFVYVYTRESGTIPYVIVGCYNITAEDFTDQFTQYMAQEYSDLQVTSQESMITLNDREFSCIVYSYNVGGYVVQDTRLFFAENGNTYMFGAKEIPELSYYVGSTLEETAGSFAHLAGGDSDYTKHVDGTRSVTSDAAASDPIEDIESTVSDVLKQGGAGNDTASGGTVGNIGGVSSSVEDGQTGADSSDGSGDGTQMGSITFSQDTVGYAGTWVPFEDGFQLYLPSDWDVYNADRKSRAKQGVLFILQEILPVSRDCAWNFRSMGLQRRSARPLKRLPLTIRTGWVPGGRYRFHQRNPLRFLPDRGKRLQRYHVFPSHQQAVPVLRNRRGIRG